MSIPRDTWVNIPDRRANRIATAYSAGGPSLLIRTVEGLTDLRIDHFAVIDFAGFRSMVDAVGGIDVDVPAPVGAFGRVGITWTARRRWPTSATRAGSPGAIGPGASSVRSRRS